MKRKKSAFPRLLACAAVLLCMTAMLLLLPFFKGAYAARGRPVTAGQITALLPGHGITGFSDILPAMPLLAYGQNDYSALLTVENENLCLPIREPKDGDDGTEGPFRDSGSVYDNTLVIGGMNIGGQFGCFARMDIGDPILLTDMRGRDFYYRVLMIRRTRSPDWDAFRAQGADLILYAFTPYRDVSCVVLCRKQTVPQDAEDHD